MLEEMYDKFKLQLQNKKTGNIQLPEIIDNSEEQVHHVCSYNHYRVKDSDLKMELSHNDIYDNDELTHEFEYGLFEDIIKTEQLMADLRQIDQYDQICKEKEDTEYSSFPIQEFKQAGQVENMKDPGLQEAAAAELYNLEQKVTFDSQQYENSAPQVSHVQQDNIDEIYHHVHTVHCPVYVPYNEEKQEILLPSTTEMSRKENAKASHAEENIDKWNSDPYLDAALTDTETFSYGHYNRPKQVMVQAVYIGNYARICADIKGEAYSLINYAQDGSLEGIYDDTYTIPMYVDNGTTVNLMPTKFYEKATYLHHLPKHSAEGEVIRTGNGTIKAHFWTDIQVNIQGCLLQLKILVCDTQTPIGILISKMTLEQLQTWQDYSTSSLYIKQTVVPLFTTQ